MSLRIVAHAAALALFAFAAPIVAEADPINFNADLCAQREGTPAATFSRGRFLVVDLNLPAPPLQPPQQPSPSQTQRETVIVDGILMELPRWVIDGMIKNGTFIVVYAGTTIPVSDPCLKIFGLDCP